MLSKIVYERRQEYEKTDVHESKKNPDPFGVGLSFPGPYFTAGAQFRVAVDNNTDDDAGYGEEYVGYYHIHMDDDGNEIYMAGSIHDPNEAHDVIVPVADIVQISTARKIVEKYNPMSPGGDPTMPMQVQEVLTPIGDVPDFGSSSSYTASKPFKIEKFVSINGVKKTTTEAFNTVYANEPEQRISDVYRGTLKLIHNEAGEPVGIEGNIGVRHGLAFYYMGDLITTVEVDALDFRVKQFQPVQPNSKLLHCLLTKLKNDPKYKLLTSYIFSMKKITGTLAIYNDMGFLASVGEITPGEKDGNRNVAVTSRTDTGDWLFKPKAGTNTRSDWDSGTDFPQIQMKPGSRAFVATEEFTEELKFETGDDPLKRTYGLPDYYGGEKDTIYFKRRIFQPSESWVGGNEGWEHPKDRPAFTPFTLSWDEWDRELLRNSVARIKKLFRQHYYSRKRRPGDRERSSPARIKLKNLKARLFPTPGAGVLPWWQRKRLKENPYDADGNMCDGPDILG